jgi:hypothetical protein
MCSLARERGDRVVKLARKLGINLRLIRGEKRKTRGDQVRTAGTMRVLTGTNGYLQVLTGTNGYLRVLRSGTKSVRMQRATCDARARRSYAMSPCCAHGNVQRCCCVASLHLRGACRIVAPLLQRSLGAWQRRHD